MAIVPGGAPLTMAGGVREFAAATPDAVAVVDGDRRLTYRGLHDRSSRLANALLERGLRPGDRVAVLLGNRMEYPEVIAGLTKAGLTLVPVGTRSSPAEAAHVLDHSGSRAVVLDGALSGVVADAAAGRVVLSLGRTDLGPSYDAALASAPSRDPRVPVDELAPFAVYYTAGTTGTPKGVLSSHRARALLCYLSALEWGLGVGRTSVAVAPMHHGAGMVFGYAPVLTGGTVTMLRSWNPERLLRLVERDRAHAAFLVPTHAHALRALGEAALRDHDLSSLDTLYFNAAALPSALKTWVMEAFPRAGVHELYGSTEAGIVANCRPADAHRVGSVGPPWYLTDVRIVDDDGAPVAPGEPGELFSRSPFLMSGYLDDPAATRACVTDDGYLTSGDIVTRDADGFLRVVDRRTDMIITGGVNVAPREVEEVLHAFPGVAEAAVVGLPDERWGERVAAFVVPAPGHAPDAAALDAHCRARLSGPKLPRALTFVDSLPRNASGKILKRELREKGRPCAPTSK
ncbi:class I adenylate-forming enzyme family protein [Actinomadura kijaniata]|uniref:class I adenylate-forming enzyme family protein n=1 Tax=Actinomadura kijaniata TaxID=46161 RepID=UPI0009FEA37A|nr:AMP-binding protein [Actinomadura kijaniata]